jgi:hypothetical protein
LLADKARAIHAVEVVQGNLNTDEVQFDEQESFVKTNNLPVSIAIAVDGRKIPRKNGGGKIIDIKVGTMPARGRNAKKSQAQYGFQEDERPYICRTVLNNVRIATMGGDITITTDAKPAYTTYVRDMLPLATHQIQSQCGNERRQLQP